MDPQTIFNAAIAIGCVIGGALLKSIYDAIKDLRHSDGEIHERINAIPNTYMRRDDFLGFAGEIRASLLRIENKLDGKADK